MRRRGRERKGKRVRARGREREERERERERERDSFAFLCIFPDAKKGRGEIIPSSYLPRLYPKELVESLQTPSVLTVTNSFVD